MRLDRRLFLGGALALAVPVSAGAQEPMLEMARGVLDIRSGESVHRFTIEIADDAQERARGLMFRESMAREAGMLFIYEQDRIASFWMKNTFIPLDMLFIASDGTIMQVAPDAQPHNLTPIRSDKPVRAVLEINGGLAAELGIGAGDRVTLYRPKR